jgi:secondary thiamine-phosphate synthase enzyme
MIQEFYTLEITTTGQKLYEFTDKTTDWINKLNFKNGILNLSIQHTSASLIVQENADPDVQIDLINYFNKLVPMNNELYVHTAEGIDDMPSHIKSTLTNNQISLSVKNGNLLLGTWQGLYLFEHRIKNQKRSIIHHFIGE